MKKIILAAALALAACGQSTTPTATETTAAPTGLMEQALAKPAEERPVFGWTLLTTYLTTHPDAGPACTSVRETAARGVIPANVLTGSIYEPYAGSLVYSVQCGPQLTTVRADPREHWLVVLAPGATEPTVISCADAHGVDRCIMPIPHNPV